MKVYVIKEAFVRNNKGIKNIWWINVRNFIKNILFTLIRGTAVAQMSYEAQKEGAKYTC